MFDELDLAKNSILCVSDNPEELDFLANILKNDYILYKEKDEKSAIKKAIEKQPDMILLSAPDMVHAFKDTPETKEIPIIILLELDNLKDEEDEFSYDAIDYIIKPLPPIVVRSRVRNHIRLINQKRILDSLSDLDKITGVFSAKFFLNRLSQEWRRAIRDKKELSLLILSIDDFESQKKDQQVNILKEVANISQDNIRRPMDIIAYFEKELFVVLLPNTPAYGAVTVGEKIRNSIEKSSTTNVTASLAVSSATPTADSEFKNFLSAAMEAFSNFKKAEKNAVCTIFSDKSF